MIIGVLSDTHLRTGQTLPTRVWEELSKVDLIIHAGDILNSEVLMDLSSLAPVEAVRGNCDGCELAKLPEQRILICEGKRIGLTHGAFGPGKTTPERAFRAFDKSEVDIIVFGHSHTPYLQWQEGILLFNPGSATDKRRELKYSMGLLKIESIGIEAKHLYF
ncbi:metallophosphoesterase family protein [Desulfitobacterium metallireducens]|uniref:Phosphoesterase n=1 Tax=Desulfitobacterium metallireducens DSM 15288 TaxID=871968 RepID=W0ECD3_9FIRM|nr:metallophosphoesterase [Desulfitobacterium metallireducens]AHF06716.1 phosphoesterase [Desulfitobacterium metallireducens DSM 15288]